MATYSFTLRGATRTGPDLKTLSEAFEQMRDASGEGASTFPSPMVRDWDGNRIARISYNGRVWSLTTEERILYDNR